MPRIDIHTHFQCLDFVKHLLGRRAFPWSVLDGGTYAVECAAGFRVPALPKIIDMDGSAWDRPSRSGEPKSLPGVLL